MEIVKQEAGGARRAAGDYRRLLSTLDQWFAKAQSRHPGVIPCRGGCSACCYGPFDISAADAELVTEAVRALPEDERREVGLRAREALARMQELAPRWEAPWDIAALGEDAFDRLAEAMAGAPCPLLDDSGRCRIYADRPLVCRMMGLGMRTARGVIENACPIRQHFPAYAVLPPEPFDLDEFEAAEAPLLASAAERLFGDRTHANYETTIAGAIVQFSR